MGDGWQLIPAADEEAIKTAWLAHLQRGENVVAPAPSQSWQGEALARCGPELKAEFADKLLAALRCLTRPGERLWVIEWLHAWYFLDPHAAVGGWPYPPLPDGDACNVVAPDFRFGLVSGWRQTGPVTLFGAELLAAFAADPPAEFLRTCGPASKGTPNMALQRTPGA